MVMENHDPTPLISTSSTPEAHSSVVIEHSTFIGLDLPIREFTLRNCARHNVQVKISCLEDCEVTGSLTILTECSIYGSTLRDVKLIGCSVFEKIRVRNSKLTIFSARYSKLIKCNINLSVIKGCNIQDGIINKCGAENSELLGATRQIMLCPLSTLFKFGIFQAFLNRCNFDHGSRLVEIWTTAPYRRQIYSLIRALRGDEKLYHELLEVQKNLVEFKIGRFRGRKLVYLPDHAVNTVKKLVINHIHFGVAPNIIISDPKPVQIRMKSAESGNGIESIRRVSQWTVNAKNLRRISVQFQWWVEFINLNDMVQMVNKGFGMQGLLERVSTGYKLVWSWEASESSVLEWSETSSPRYMLGYMSSAH
ncbi:uncharacterized protein RCO7_08052 [Rhynchosporium graminicola]|uniref:Uncharacterized protein n=1 Tax=Rhynchosporium graminicola TaxID=2792576 RepID=A0A1E1K721_9HELO|nr:uncharacterized protein RCO7_08052 [Rhynchosporium commune]